MVRHPELLTCFLHGASIVQHNSSKKIVHTGIICLMLDVLVQHMTGHSGWPQYEALRR
ncbi:hypothetical protein B9Z19DRAFT_1073622 [Tuber borchii]|uniref:Uncharacterized protein n=1 Tax=Tuber borchii TaxID=42251 RepID=A0A2T7A5I6_TUBBO|nr:hypothetical protein B9Z19DRAFT_1073622 [Tuber borchii]